jgi:hypothetical protein
MDMVVRAVLMGIGATLLMDLWAILRKWAFGVSSLDYAMLGRWLGHMPAGRFAHPDIGSAPSVRGERIIGRTAHYVIGVTFAALLLTVCGEGWARQPTPGPALAVGIVTVVAPLFIMQPGMGLGVAASRMPKPNVARLRSLVMHIVFGLGLYGSAWILAQMTP